MYVHVIICKVIVQCYTVIQYTYMPYIPVSKIYTSFRLSIYIYVCECMCIAYVYYTIKYIKLILHTLLLLLLSV